MISDIRSYFHVRKCNTLSRQYSKRLGSNRAIDVYWSDENHNYIITKKENPVIIKEFLTARGIVFDELVIAWQRLEHGNSYRQESKLQDIAIQANKDKQKAKRREVVKHYASEGWDHDAEGKRSVPVLG